MEIGETFEMAVARETKEEAGVTVESDSVRYCVIAFQPQSSLDVCLAFTCLILESDALKEFSGMNVTVEYWCRYESSQPWPFPSSLMVGFHCAAVKNKCEPYNGLEAHGDAVPVGIERVPEVDEVNALPRPAVDVHELEVFTMPVLIMSTTLFRILKTFFSIASATEFSTTRTSWGSVKSTLVHMLKPGEASLCCIYLLTLVFFSCAYVCY